MTGEIYCIENLINGKKYIGQTKIGWENRWKQHKQSINKQSCFNYPIYQAIRKYGVDNFTCYLLEQVGIEKLNERESYWINFYDTFYSNKKGYNATLGGAGHSTFTIDDDEIIQIYKEIGTVTGTMKFFNASYENISNCLTRNNIKVKPIRFDAIKVEQYDIEGKLLNIYDSIADAARSLTKGGTLNTNFLGSISKVLPLKNRLCHGYQWKAAGSDKKIFPIKLSPRILVKQIGDKGEILNEFSTITKAAKFILDNELSKASLIKSISTSISKAARIKIKTYGFYWQIEEIEDGR